ncbi:MAG TPA: RNA polymerase sigma factor, partial [Gemmataceae bacterium]|nr:RNA polymerase sigma factor [Gemmataceae bacterium]
TKALSDEDLLRGFTVTRDEGCFLALLRRHGSMVQGVCRALLPNEADAEDAFQATFLVLAKKASSVRTPGSVSAWLHGVAYRTASRSRVDLARRRKHEARATLPEATPPEEMTWREVQCVLHEEMARLGEGYRAPLVLCYLQGKTQEEAARLMGLPKGTLKGRLERGRALLRKQLERRGLALASVLLAWPFANTSAHFTQSAATTARAAAPFMAGGTAQGIVSEYAIHLSKGVMQDMFISKVKMLTATLAGCVAALVVTVNAEGQRPGEDDKKKEAPPAAEAKSKVEARPLSPKALAAHLGVINQSFDLTFEKPVAGVTFSIDVYEKGVRTVEGRAKNSREGFAEAKHACSVLYSRGKEQGKLLITIVTAAGSYHELIEDPFGGELNLTWPDPRMDAEGRFPLALQGGPGDPSKATVANSDKAIVVQVRTK